MIDWCPSTERRCVEDPAAELTRWRGVMDLRRVANTIDAGHPGTRGHHERVSELAALIAMEAGWLERRTRQMREVALVHDVGKVCVPDGIRLRDGPITPEEYELVKTHATVGARIVATVMLPRQVEWVRHHHERWDGRGYPDGLCGEEIPSGAAILGLADAWDAMTNRRWGGPPLDEEAALAECRRESGRQFAPWAVAALEGALERRIVGSGARPPAPLQLVPAA